MLKSVVKFSFFIITIISRITRDSDKFRTIDTLTVVVSGAFCRIWSLTQSQCTL